jgi:N-acetylglucosamine-6-phosphate deacetylase
VFKDTKVVLESSGYLHREGTTQLAGSTSTMMGCMNHLASIGELNADGLMKVGYENPLKLLGIELKKESIEEIHPIVFKNYQFRFKH